MEAELRHAWDRESRGMAGACEARGSGSRLSQREKKSGYFSCAVSPVLPEHFAGCREDMRLELAK